MESLFQFLPPNPYILLFFVVGMAVAIGRVTIAGYGLGMFASAIVVGAAVATAGSMYGVTLQLDNVAKSLVYDLFMYGVGLRVGPSFINSLKGDGMRFAFLAVLCSCLGLAGAVLLSKAFHLPPGAAGGIVAVSGVLLTVFGYVAMVLS